MIFFAIFFFGDNLVTFLLGDPENYPKLFKISCTNGQENLAIKIAEKGIPVNYKEKYLKRALKSKMIKVVEEKKLGNVFTFYLSLLIFYSLRKM